MFRTLLLSSLLVFSFPLMAKEKTDQVKSPCKNKLKRDCTKLSACSWVKRHKKAGKNVVGFCRKAPQKK